MNFKDILENECGNVNPLMRLGRQMTADTALRDEGISANFHEKTFQPEGTFRMDMLLKEMQEMDRIVQQPVMGPKINEVINDTVNPVAGPLDMNPDSTLAEFWQKSLSTNYTNAQNNVWSVNNFPSTSLQPQYRPYQRPNYSRFFPSTSVTAEPQSSKFFDLQQQSQSTADDFFKEVEQVTKEEGEKLAEDWTTSFEESKKAEEEFNEQYNKEFWDRLQDEWKKLSAEDNNREHPWLHDFSDYYDPYKEYKFDENNPMIDVENALEKGKAFLSAGDIPSAVLCFESAVKQEPENAEAWKLLGTSQAENEKDPNAIAALKRSLELNPNDLNVLLSLAISYTNESYQSLALKMLNQWLKANPKYSDLAGPGSDEAAGIEEITTSRIRAMDLQETQELFLKAVQQNAQTQNFDPDVQEALGVLFNLSSEYDKAVDCFQAAVELSPDNAKLWNRLGASYANGNRPIDAVGAYQRALEIEPGFIRARYNVGVVCINLKSYKEAAEHLLLALNHQASSKQRAGINIDNMQNQMSDTLWSTLRMTISLSGRHNLQDFVDKKDLESLNREFGMET